MEAALSLGLIKLIFSIVRVKGGLTKANDLNSLAAAVVALVYDRGSYMLLIHCEVTLAWRM